jgi:RNA polymerase subunit RPABC4/transcription elongation factor Spt4
MENPSSPSGIPRTCPSCGYPVPPGDKFCENCGTKIEDIPVCRKCGAPIIPPDKFCSVCGTPAVRQEKPQEIVTDPTPSQPAQQSVPPVQKPVLPVQQPVQQPVQKPVPPVQKPAPAPVSRAPEIPKAAAGEKPASLPEPALAKVSPNRTRIILGIVVLLVVIAGIYFVGIPALKGGSAGSGVPPVPSTPVVTQTEVSTFAQTLASTPVQTTAPSPHADALVPLPTQQPPKTQEVLFQVQKDPVDAKITAIMAGGPGLNSLNYADVRVTHPDGTVETATLQPDKDVNEVVLTGSKTTDRVEIIAEMYNGQTYRVIDELLTYKER